ncbi:M20/M25/M40 family metallo-hydrolase [Pararhizobium haloflavum]|uniref:M20/M25/M40 family metallo-hydrolase n=1 Tax=Pararhizobium haloflavum TaxID=2037914 RepID=UPI0012FFF74D|nr:M20/M25/M40 family metallo-hydrolase [Pararhizobium haloflavum]
MHDDLAMRARELSYTLVGWPSVTGSKDEAAFAPRLLDLLSALPYFKDHPEDLMLVPVPGDPNGRASVLALVRGTGRRTVALAGHFDVVPIDDYTDLAPLAGSPDALREALIERLKTTGSHPQALHDLESGAFLPGRGMLDMKSGVAAGIAVLEAFSREEAREGNVLLIATPDEEENSCGMRSISAMLRAFLAERGLDVPLAINLDATCDTGDGQNGRVVTMGSIGKLLISAYVVGKDAHACYPFDGVNSAYLAAELAVEFECAPELGEVTRGEVASPPSTLALKDNKDCYNVTTPGRSWLFWNVLAYQRTPIAIFETARMLAERAVSRARQRMAERAAALGASISPTPVWNDIRVLSFAELMGMAGRQPGLIAAFAQRADALAATSLDLPERSRQLTEFLVDGVGIDGAAVVIGNASMPYPAITWPATRQGEETARLIEAGVAPVREREGISIERRAFFPAISDMSFLGPRDGAGLAVTAENSPLWGTGIDLDANEAGAAIPVINIGPWGRDYHHWLERTHVDYTFRVLPALVQSVIRSVIGGETDR